MSDDAPQIQALIDRLDHPDARLQDEILEQLAGQPERARPVVLSQLAEASPRLRRALLRWLDDHLDARATLPLMRYVFDEAGTIAEQTGRSMAMALLLRRARQPEGPEEVGRLRAFAEDICGDDHPDVRRLALKILEVVGNDNSLESVNARLDDSDDEVRKTARATRQTLENIATSTTDNEQPESASRLTRRLLQSAGPLRRQLLRRWRRHPERDGIALRILERHGALRREALQILIDRPRPEAREYLPSIIREDVDGELAPLALRLMAKTADPDDVGDDEIGAVRLGIHAASVLTRAASCSAAASLDLHDLVPTMISLSESRERNEALDAARHLVPLLGPSDHELFYKLHTALKTNERRRRREPDDQTRIRIVAHLLKAMRQIVSPSTIGVESLYPTIFELLASGANRRPLRVTALQLLMASTPDDGLREHNRWSPRSVNVLIDLIDGADRPTARHIANLLLRGAPRGMPELDDATYRLWQSGHVNIAHTIVPLLELAQSERADQWLQELADGDREPAGNEARRVLRRRRNDQDVIDVEFIPRDDAQQ